MVEFVVGELDEFPAGTHRVVKAGKAEVGVFNVNGVLYALPNVCPHQAGPLCTGPVTGTFVCNAETGFRHEWRQDGELVTCPWHGLEFEIATGRCLASSRYRLRTYAVRVDDEKVIVSF
ncbi:MAG: Rieske (2Fe-2S) protein [Thermomicrobiales bacterium]